MAPSIWLRKRRFLFADLVDRLQAEDLKATTVGQDRALPSAHGVQAAEPLHRFMPGTQGEVVGVAKNHLGTRARDLIDRRRL